MAGEKDGAYTGDNPQDEQRSAPTGDDSAHHGHAQDRPFRFHHPGSPGRQGFTDLAGKRFDTGQLKGKSVVLYFWTDACGCTEQLIALRPFIAGLKDKPFAFVTINEGQGKAVAERFIRNNRLPYQALLDDDLSIGRKSFGIKVLPTIFIIGGDGILKEKLIGVVDNKRLEAFISRNL